MSDRDLAFEIYNFTVGTIIARFAFRTDAEIAVKAINSAYTQPMYRVRERSFSDTRNVG